MITAEKCEPYWAPLEKLFKEGKVDIHDFMYMATYTDNGVDVHTYKHSIGRRYLNLDDQGNAHMYDGSNSYTKVPLNDAIAYALNQPHNLPIRTQPSDLPF